MITHHPDPSSLMSCSAGSMPEPLAAVMAAHISLCPLCRKKLSHLESLGTLMFSSLPPTELAGCRPVAAAAAEPDTASRRVCARGELPDAVVEVLRPTGKALPWRRIGLGLWVLPIPLSEGVVGKLTLVKVAPGVAIPEHGHSGSELTIILDGAYTDELGTFKVGDVADIDDTVEHRPVAHSDQGCICLTATEGRSQFKGLMARLIAPLAGF